MSRELILVIYRSLKSIIAQIEREYKLGIYAVTMPVAPPRDDGAKQITQTTDDYSMGN